MRNNEPMPTNMYNAIKTDHIVKARTIHEPKIKVKIKYFLQRRSDLAGNIYFISKKDLWKSITSP